MNTLPTQITPSAARAAAEQQAESGLPATPGAAPPRLGDRRPDVPGRAPRPLRPCAGRAARAAAPSGGRLPRRPAQPGPKLPAPPRPAPCRVVLLSGMEWVSHSHPQCFRRSSRCTEGSCCRASQVALVSITPGSPVSGIPLDCSPFLFQQRCSCFRQRVQL